MPISGLQQPADGDPLIDEAALAEEARRRAAARTGKRAGMPPLPGAGLGDAVPFGMVPPGWGARDAGPIDDDEMGALRSGAVAADRSTVFDRGTAAIPAVGDVATMMQSGGNGGAAPTNDPLAMEPQPIASANVPLPRPRPNGIGEAEPAAAVDRPPLSLAPPNDPAALPPTAQPTQGQQPAAPAGPSLIDRILDPNKAATYLALGAGFAGAPSFGTGMRRAFSNAVPAVAADRAFSTKQQSVADTYRALVAKGVPPAEALAASQNPEIMKATAAKYFEAKPRVPHKLGTDMMGNDIMGSFDPNTGRFYDAGNNPIGGGTANGGKGTTIPGSNANVLAKGVTEYNSELPAEEYLAQFSPEVKASIESYVNGDTMPTSNPRLKALATKVKEWAQTYGSKANIPVSDAEFSRKRTMQNQIGSSSPNSMGGILSNGKSAFGHLATLSDNFVDLGNRSGPDIPGGSWLGRGANYTGNSILPTPETSGKLEAVRDNAGKYGAEATKFYAGTGGGVEERLSALHGIASPGSLATEQAAYLRTEKDLMLERLSQKEAQIRETMGERWLQQHPVKTSDLQRSIDRIDANIKRLTSGAVGGSPAAKPGVTSSGIKWSVQ